MAETKDLNVEVDVSLITRLKVYAAIVGQPVKVIVARWLDEKLPPLPQESEATHDRQPDPGHRPGPLGRGPPPPPLPVAQALVVAPARYRMAPSAGRCKSAWSSSRPR